MKDRSSELDVAKMTRTFAHRLSARLTFEVPVDGAHPGIHQTTHFLPLAGFIHDFREFDFGYRVGFLYSGRRRLDIEGCSRTKPGG